MIDKTCLLSILVEIKACLAEFELWETKAPPAKALASQAPFALDSLTPTQWLQWIFLPKMELMILEQQDLPLSLHLTPYFEQALAPHLDYRYKLLALIASLDSLFQN